MAWHTGPPDERGCREWTGKRDDDGYGIISDPDDTGRWVPRRAHRVAWALANPGRPVPPVVRHRCDNPPCVEPSHLLGGTHRSNQRDATERRRRLYGDAHGRTRLSDEALGQLLADHAAGAPRRTLRDRYGLSKSQVQRIVTGSARTGPPPP